MDPRDASASKKLLLSYVSNLLSKVYLKTNNIEKWNNLAEKMRRWIVESEAAVEEKKHERYEVNEKSETIFDLIATLTKSL